MPSDPRKSGSGLPDDFEATITAAEFRFDENFTDDNGDPILQGVMSLHSPDPDIEDRDQFYGCGPGWEPIDDGAGCRPDDDPDNDEKPFNGNTKMGRLVSAIVKTDAVDEVVRRYENDGVGQTDGQMFADLTFRWKIEKRPYSFKKDGVEHKGESELLLPVEFIGDDGEKPEPKKARSKRPAKKAAAKKDEAPARRSKKDAAADNGTGVDIVAEAKRLFDENEDAEFDDWVTLVAEACGMDRDADELERVRDASKAGLWAELVAS